MSESNPRPRSASLGAFIGAGVFLVAQTIAAIWWASAISSQVRANTDDVEKLEGLPAKVDMNAKAIDDHDELVEQIPTLLNEIKNLSERMGEQFEDLDKAADELKLALKEVRSDPYTGSEARADFRLVRQELASISAAVHAIETAAARMTEQLDDQAGEIDRQWTRINQLEDRVAQARNQLKNAENPPPRGEGGSEM
ncbi:MAG: hypothetical protein AAGE65_09530 [Planctomycetota bacterium]